MRYEKEFRKAKPHTVGEKDKDFDNRNYAEWLESQLKEEREIKVINSILFYQGKLCSYRTKKIRSFIEKVAETNDSFNLPAGYTIKCNDL
jgi:hypothetical protein